MAIAIPEGTDFFKAADYVVEPAKKSRVVNVRFVEQGIGWPELHCEIR